MHTAHKFEGLRVSHYGGGVRAEDERPGDVKPRDDTALGRGV